jgi:type II secretory pathway component PulF
MDNKPQGNGLVGFAGWLLTHVAAAVVLLYVLVKVVPGYAVFFAELAIKLPVMTQLTITFSRLACQYWWLVVPLGCVDAAILFGLCSLPASARWLATVWAVLVLLVALLLAGVAFVAVSGPFADVQRALS